MKNLKKKGTAPVKEAPKKENIEPPATVENKKPPEKPVEIQHQNNRLQKIHLN